jgi:hypothetical protein
MKRVISLLRRHGLAGTAKIIISRISGAELALYKREIHRLNDRPQRIHPYVDEALSLLSLERIEPTDLNGLLDGPLKGKFTKFGSDKESRHNYREIYDSILSNFVNPRILEIGLGSVNPFPYAGLPPGGSTRAFREAYPTATIIGCDIDPASVEAIDELGFVVDQTSGESLQNLYEVLEAKYEFDLIIDDGFHDIHANIRTLIHLIPLLSNEGFYVIEDVHENMIQIWSLIQHLLPGRLTICDLRQSRPMCEDNILLILRKVA